MPCRTCRQYLASSDDDEDRLQLVMSEFQATRRDSLALRNRAIELRQQSQALRGGRDGPGGKMVVPPRPPDPLYRMLQLVCAVTMAPDSAPYWALFRDVVGL